MPGHSQPGPSAYQHGRRPTSSPTRRRRPRGPGYRHRYTNPHTQQYRYRQPITRLRRGPIARSSSGHNTETRDMATWCHIGGGGEASYASSTSWETQLRPPRGAVPAPAPFTGRTLEDLRRIDPLHPLPEEAFVGWCEICDQCMVSERAHNSSPRHKAQEQMYQKLHAALVSGPQKQVARRLLNHLKPERPAPVQRLVPSLPVEHEDPLQDVHLLDMDGS